jgi:hypothetical protein
MVADSSSLVFHRDPEAVFADLIEKGHEAEWQGAHVLESRSEDHRRRPLRPVRLLLSAAVQRSAGRRNITECGAQADRTAAPVIVLLRNFGMDP